MKKTTEWIDVTDDALMVSLGLRYPNAEGRDPSVWTKSEKEKAILKKVRNSFSGTLCKGGGKQKYEPLLKGKLRFTIKKDDRFTTFDSKLKRRVHKTTFSVSCYKKDIPFILNRYVNEDGKSLITKYAFVY